MALKTESTRNHAEEENTFLVKDVYVVNFHNSRWATFLNPSISKSTWIFDTASCKVYSETLNKGKRNKWLSIPRCKYGNKLGQS